MKTKQDLKSEIEKRHIIHFKANLFFSDSKYLNDPASDEERNVAGKSSFIRKVRYAYWVLSVLEFCKIYGKSNDHYSMEKLINKLWNNYSNSEWNTLLSKEDIARIRENYNRQEIQTIIVKLRGLRDEYYAHLDRNPKKTINDYTPNYHEVETLLNLHESFLKEVSLKVFSTEILFNNPSSGRADGILQNLAEHQDKVISDNWKHR